jgi:hypothetical protein
VSDTKTTWLMDSIYLHSSISSEELQYHYIVALWKIFFLTRSEVVDSCNVVPSTTQVDRHGCAMFTVYLPTSDFQVTLLRYICYGIIMKTLKHVVSQKKYLHLPVRELEHMLTCAATVAHSSLQIIFPESTVHNSQELSSPLEKPAVSKLIKNFPTFHGAQIFIRINVLLDCVHRRRFHKTWISLRFGDWLCPRPQVKKN